MRKPLVQYTSIRSAKTRLTMATTQSHKDLAISLEILLKNNEGLISAQFDISVDEAEVFRNMNIFEIDDSVDSTLRSQITRYTAAMTEFC